MTQDPLTPLSPLAGYARSFCDTHLAEVTTRALYSLARPQGDEAAVDQTLHDTLGLTWPAPGRATTSKQGAALGLTTDQAMLALPDDNPLPEPLTACAWTTLQTDAWVILHLRGPDTLPALERLCPVNTHPEVFRPGHLARTSIEHMGAIVWRETEEDYLLLSARSSAASFLHAIETTFPLD